jgi:hypothetical protein
MLTSMMLALSPLRAPPPRMNYAQDLTGTLGKEVMALEEKCANGDQDSCVMLDQLSGYAQTLFDTSARRGKAADAPDFSKEQPSNPYGVVGGEYAAAAAAAIEAFDMAKVPAGSVQEALVKLFNSYDTQKKGVLSLETFYQVRACACVSTCNAHATLSL